MILKEFLEMLENPLYSQHQAGYFAGQQRAELIEALKARPEAMAQEPFVVKHYTSDERPTIKGNGFDGLEIGTDRDEADVFVAWINARLRMNSGGT